MVSGGLATPGWPSVGWPSVGWPSGEAVQCPPTDMTVARERGRRPEGGAGEVSVSQSCPEPVPAIPGGPILALGPRPGPAPAGCTTQMKTSATSTTELC